MRDGAHHARNRSRSIIPIGFQHGISRPAGGLGPIDGDGGVVKPPLITSVIYWISSVMHASDHRQRKCSDGQDHIQ